MASVVDDVWFRCKVLAAYMTFFMLESMRIGFSWARVSWSRRAYDNGGRSSGTEGVSFQKFPRSLLIALRMSERRGCCHPEHYLPTQHESP